MAPKKASKDFNRARARLFSVSVCPETSIAKCREKNYTDDTKAMIGKIKRLARQHGYADQIEIRSDDGGALDRRGYFFISAPEKFADLVRKLDGVTSVEKPAPRKAAAASKPSSKKPARKR